MYKHTTTHTYSCICAFIQNSRSSHAHKPYRRVPKAENKLLLSMGQKLGTLRYTNKEASTHLSRSLRVNREWPRMEGRLRDKSCANEPANHALCFHGALPSKVLLRAVLVVLLVEVLRERVTNLQQAMPRVERRRHATVWPRLHRHTRCSS